MEYTYSGSGDYEPNDTNSSSCVADTLNYNNSYLPRHVDISSRAVLVVYTHLIILLGNLMGFFILFLIIRYEKLHTISFSIGAQIAVANICSANVQGFPTIMNNIAGRWILGLNFCIISAFILFLSANIRTLLLFVFALDRFASVFSPFHYTKYSHITTTILCAFSWLVSIALSFILIPQWLDCYEMSEAILFCFYSSQCNGNCQTFEKIYIFLFVLPTILIPTGLFIGLYIKGRQIRRKELKMLGLAKKTITDKDWRALKTFFLLFLAVFLVIIPPIVLSLITAKLGDIIHNISLKLGSMIIDAHVVTDFIIILRNADVREVSQKLRAETRKMCSKLYSSSSKENSKS